MILHRIKFKEYEPPYGGVPGFFFQEDINLNNAHGS